MWQEYGYFSHPGKVMKGKLYALKEVMGNGKADRCAEECDKVPDCQGMAISASPASCLLFGGEALHFCDSTAADCGGAAIDPADENSMSIDVNDNPMTIDTVKMLPAKLAAGMKYDEMYWWDKEGLYCTTQSDECAAAREYFDCLQAESCTAESDYDAHRDLCQIHACSPAQCGFDETDCASMVAVCADHFMGCLRDSFNTSTPDTEPCSCTKHYMNCLQRAECLADPTGKLLGSSMEEFAFADGCTADDLGKFLDVPS